MGTYNLSLGIPLCKHFFRFEDDVIVKYVTLNLSHQPSLGDTEVRACLRETSALLVCWVGDGQEMETGRVENSGRPFCQLQLQLWRKGATAITNTALLPQ